MFPSYHKIFSDFRRNMFCPLKFLLVFLSAEAAVPFVRKIAISETAVTPQGYSKSVIYGCQEAASKRGSFKSPFHLHKCPAPLKIPCVCCIILLNLNHIACDSNSIQTRRNKKCFAQIAETTSLMQTHRSAPTAVLS